MAARATGSGVISFGMVSIPVKLYSTVDTTQQIRFNMLRKDGARLKQQYVAATDGEVVDKDDIVKGYEFAKGQYVLFTDEEMKAMNAKSTGEIAIQEFIPTEQVSPVYIERANYLGPDKGAARSYQLLAEAMRKTGRAALAKYAAAEVKKQELDLAIQLIDQVSSEEFHPENYRDEVRDHMLEVIDQKVNGENVVVAEEEQPEAKIIDIMDALKASLKEQDGGKAKKAKSAPKKEKAKQKARKKASRK